MSEEQDRRIAQLLEQLQVQAAEQQQQKSQLHQLMAAATAGAPSPPTSSSASSSSRLRGHHLPKFDGKPASDVKNWLHQVGMSIAASASPGLPLDHLHVVSSIGLALLDDAASWFRSSCEAGSIVLGVTTWEDLRSALLRRFAPLDEQQQAFTWFQDIDRGAAGATVESISSFISTLMTKAAIIRSHMSDTFGIAFLLRALPPTISTQLLLSPSDSLEVTAGVAIRLSRTLALEGFLRSSSTFTSSSTATTATATFPPFAFPPPAPAIGPVPMELAAIQSRGSSKCNYCHQPGHWARDKVTKKATCPVLIRREAEAAAAAAHP